MSDTEAAFGASTLPLAADGYTESELFMSGTTNTYEPAGTWGTNGKWNTTSRQPGCPTRPGSWCELPRTRPSSAGRSSSNGSMSPRRSTSILTGPWSTPRSSPTATPGSAWTAQAAGVTSLREWDSTRYGSLNESNDSQSYDIYSQAGKAVRDQSQLILGTNSNNVKTLLADGESQSAVRMLTYTDAVQNTAHVYDGITIHSEFGTSVPIGNSLAGVVSDTQIRTDIDVPVMLLETETDLILGYAKLQQPDNAHLRTWEVTGSTHYDLYGLTNMVNEMQKTLAISPPLPTTSSGLQSFFGCSLPLDNLTFHVVEDAALNTLTNWVETGATPPSARFIATVIGTIVRDHYGNAEGGLRIPDIQVPTATYSGSNPAGGPNDGALSGLVCQIFGFNVPLTNSQLTALYPSHAAYVADVTAAANVDVTEGYLLGPDAQALIATANASSIT